MKKIHKFLLTVSAVAFLAGLALMFDRVASPAPTTLLEAPADLVVSP